MIPRSHNRYAYQSRQWVCERVTMDPSGVRYAILRDPVSDQELDVPEANWARLELLSEAKQEGLEI